MEWLNSFNVILSLLIGRLVVNTGDNGLPPDIMLEGGNERSMDVEVRSTSYGSCLGGRMCVPMSDCAAMYYEVAKSCYNGDRSMYCGGTQYEPYICCPKSPLEQSSVCGKTLVSGQFYRGLGAFPFVARIGFKSKYFQSADFSLFFFISVNERPNFSFMPQVYCRFHINIVPKASSSWANL